MRMMTTTIMTSMDGFRSQSTAQLLPQPGWLPARSVVPHRHRWSVLRPLQRRHLPWVTCQSKTCTHVVSYLSVTDMSPSRELPVRHRHVHISWVTFPSQTCTHVMSYLSVTDMYTCSELPVHQRHVHISSVTCPSQTCTHLVSYLSVTDMYTCRELPILHGDKIVSFWAERRGLEMMMSWCLMSSDVIWHIRDKLWPMPKHGSIKSTYVRCMRV